MQVTVETTSNLGRKLNIIIPNEQIEEKIVQKLNQIASQVKLDGFRPGKVPLNVIKQRFGQTARQEVVGEVLQHTLYEAIMKEDLKPAGIPEISSIQHVAGSPLEYTAIFDVYPEIKLIDFKALKAEKFIVEIVDADIEEMLKNIRTQRANWKSVQRTSKLEDRLTIDFEGFKDGVAFSGGKATDTPIILGSKTFIPGFEEGLINKTAGDEIELPLTFPENYHAKDLAGAAVIFKIKIKEVAEPELPALDAEFAKTMGVESGDVAEFKAQVKEHMQRELEQAIRTKEKQALFQQLIENHSFDIPESLVKNEIKAMLQQYMPKHEPTVEQIQSAPDLLKQEARHRVAIGLVIAEIIRQFDIKVDPIKVEQYIENLAKAYEDPQKMISWYYGNKDSLAGIEGVVLEQQVFDKICEAAKLEERKSTYTEFMKPKQ